MIYEILILVEEKDTLQCDHTMGGSTFKPRYLTSTKFSIWHKLLFKLIETKKKYLKHNWFNLIKKYKNFNENVKILCQGLNTKDFLSADWIKSVKPCTEAMIKMEDDMFTISRGKEKTPVKINGFPITTSEYQKALDGEKVTLSADGQTAELVVKDGNVTIDGKSLNVGSSMTMTI